MQSTINALRLAPLPMAICLAFSSHVLAATEVHLVLKKDPLIPKTEWERESRDYFANNRYQPPGGNPGGGNPGGGGGGTPTDNPPVFSVLQVNGQNMLGQSSPLDVQSSGLGGSLNLSALAADPDADASPIVYSWQIVHETPAYDTASESLSVASLSAPTGSNVQLNLPQGPFSEILLRVEAKEQDATPKQTTQQFRLTFSPVLTAHLMDATTNTQVANNAQQSTATLTEGENAVLQPYVFNHGKKVATSLPSWSWTWTPGLADAVNAGSEWLSLTSLNAGSYGVTARSSIYGVQIERVYPVQVARVDTDLPQVSLAISNQTASAVTFTANASDSSGIGSVTLLSHPARGVVSGMPLQLDGTYKYELDVRNYEEGKSFSFLARAVDGVTKASDSSVVQFTRPVDNPIVSAVPRSYNSLSNIILDVAATDSSNISKIEVFRNGALHKTANGPSWGDVVVDLSDRPMDSSNSVYVKALDPWGNSATTSAISLRRSQYLFFDRDVAEWPRVMAMSGVTWALTGSTGSNRYYDRTGQRFAVSTSMVNSGQNYAKGGLIYSIANGQGLFSVSPSNPAVFNRVSNFSFAYDRTNSIGLLGGKVFILARANTSQQTYFLRLGPGSGAPEINNYVHPNNETQAFVSELGQNIVVVMPGAGSVILRDINGAPINTFAHSVASSASPSGFAAVHGNDLYVRYALDTCPASVTNCNHTGSGSYPVLMKFDSALNIIWARQISTRGSTLGNLHVTGSGNIMLHDGRTLSVYRDSDGAFVRSVQFRQGGNNFSYCYSGDSLYGAFSSSAAEIGYSATTTNEIYYFGVSASGARKIMQIYGDGDDHPFSVACDGSALVVTGYSMSASLAGVAKLSGKDYFVFRTSIE